MVEKMRAQNKNKQINLKKEQAKNTVNWNSKSSKTFEKQSTRKSLKKTSPNSRKTTLSAALLAQKIATKLTNWMKEIVVKQLLQC